MGQRPGPSSLQLGGGEKTGWRLYSSKQSMKISSSANANQEGAIIASTLLKAISSA